MCVSGVGHTAREDCGKLQAECMCMCMYSLKPTFVSESFDLVSVRVTGVRMYVFEVHVNMHVCSSLHG